MTKLSNICGPAVARLRRKKGFTQHELRRRCDAAGWQVARSVLAKVESQTRSVSDHELVALAQALGVNVVKLLGLSLVRKSKPDARRSLKSHAVS
jgi:transcriptional regulator with XRE-family HTH domain